MKVLMTTEKVSMNDNVFAFSHTWIQALAAEVETLTVLALSVAEYELPKNVKVFSLGKERGSSRLMYVLRFWHRAWAERRNYTHVFVHMNQIYVILGAPIFMLYGKKVALWYTHKQVSWTLWLASKFVDVIFTAAEESMLLKTPKKRVVGHGIDMSPYQHSVHKPIASAPYRIVSIGRITPVKDLETLVRATGLLKDAGVLVEVTLVGPEVAAGDRAYRKKLNALILELSLSNVITFVGGKAPAEVRAILAEADFSVNLCPTGGLDKAVIESVVSGVPTLVANTAFAAYFNDSEAGQFLFTYGDATDLASKIKSMISVPPEIGNLTESWKKRFSVEGLMKVIVSNMETL